MVQPIEGLVVSIPALMDAQAFERHPLHVHRAFCDLLDPAQQGVRDFPGLLRELLGWPPDLLDTDHPNLELWVPEGRQLIRPTFGLKNALKSTDDGPDHVLLAWHLPGLPLDKPETQTGTWLYPPSAKFERLLRHTKVPVGLLCNDDEIRLVYAPTGESAGVLTFRVADMATPAGRPILDAFIMLLHIQRFFGVAPERTLPAILRSSRTRQADITTTLAAQVHTAANTLLQGFVAAADRTGWTLLDEAMRRKDDGEPDHIYNGILTVLLRLVFLLYAEDRALVPVDHPVYQKSLSITGLFDELQTDAGSFPDTMDRRFGAWPRLLACFRAVFLGAQFPGFSMPPRRGRLFDPHLYPFLEGWLGLAAPIKLAEDRAQTQTPPIDDKTVYEVLHNLLILDGQRLSYQELGVEQIGSVYENMMGYHVVREGAGLTLIAGDERKRTSSHYTPRSMTESVVRTTLAPLLAAMGENPKPEAILALKICDPAMGSGAFLVEACRYLADALVVSWAFHGQTPQGGDEPVLHARRLVAQKCLYGVDRNAFAVDLAKLSMWLLTLSRELPFTFLDHALRHGDTLVGLNLTQLRGFHWAPDAQVPFMADELERTIQTSVELRQQILSLADAPPEQWREKEWLLQSAHDAMQRARLLGDLVVGAFFEHKADKDRKAEIKRRLGLVQDWLLSGESEAPESLLGMQAEIRKEFPVFHWMLEFPEIFYAERPDPLDHGKLNKAAYMDAFIGNPPFMGGSQISGTFGEPYLKWLLDLHSGSHGNSDLAAHFFRRAATLLGAHGTIGMIATNTIAQGDTRSTGLQFLVKIGFQIYHANVNLKWPVPGANVTVSIVHLAIGTPAALLKTASERDKLTPDELVLQLDGKGVDAISSRLRPKPERPDPVSLKVNENLSYLGTKVYGQGFVLTPEEREMLVAKDPRNAERIFPYIGGQEVNSSPTQSHNRYVISFGQESLEEAERWPDLLDRVRELVKPERDKLNDNPDGRRRKEYWWQFGRWTPALYEAIARLDRVLVTSQVSKHVMFSFQPSNRIFSQKLIVFADSKIAPFGILQSRLHVRWVWYLSSTMKTDINYSPTDCFVNFPFPSSKEHKSQVEALEITASKLYDRRAQIMVDRQIGLTDLYNLLTEPGDFPDDDIADLIQQHEDLDRAVLAAYGWSDIDIPPFPTPKTPEDQARLQAFEDEIIDRLFQLNADRAELERLQGPSSKPGKSKPKQTTLL